MQSLKIASESELPQTSKFVERILQKGRVPSKLKKHIYREKLIRRLGDDIVQLRNESGCNMLVVHGMPGCGKSCFVADTLRCVPEILGHYYERVIWLVDRTTDPEKLPNVVINALVMLRSGSTLNKNYPENNVDLLRYELVEELKCNPKTLIVVDEVYISECIRFFENLPCSIVWITSNKEVFNWLHEEGSCRFFNLNKEEFFSIDEIHSLSKTYNLNLSKNQLDELAQSTGGNAALLGKFFSLTRGQNEMVTPLLHRISNDGLRALSCTTSYQYFNLDYPLKTLLNLEGVPESSRAALEYLSIFPKNTSFNLEILSLIWPLDLCGSEATDVIHGLILHDIRFLADRSLITIQEGLNLREESIYRLHPAVQEFLFKHYAKSGKNLKQMAKTVNNRLQYEAAQFLSKQKQDIQKYMSEVKYQDVFPYEYRAKTTIGEFFVETRAHLLNVMSSAIPKSEQKPKKEAQTSWLSSWFAG